MSEIEVIGLLAKSVALLEDSIDPSTHRTFISDVRRFIRKLSFGYRPKNPQGYSLLWLELRPLIQKHHKRRVRREARSKARVSGATRNTLRKRVQK